MSEVLSVAEARTRKGIKLVISAGFPGPWGEAAKGMLQAKNIPFVRVRQVPGTENKELVEWTGRSNAPQIVVDDSPPLHAGRDLIEFAERESPLPALIPSDPATREKMFQWLERLAGENGFGWYRRINLFQPILSLPKSDSPDPGIAIVEGLGRRYGYSAEAAAMAPQKIAEIMRNLSELLAEQRRTGHRYFLGDSLTALDIYWAAFATMVAPMSDDLCPMPGYLRDQYSARSAVIDAAMSNDLLSHRDFIYQNHLELPVDL